MRIFFFNAYFDPDRHEGSRVHIEQLVKHLIVLGQEVWVQPDSPVAMANALSRRRARRLAQVRRMDVLYFRIEGQPLTLPRYLRWPWVRLGFEKKIVWEINAASDYVALASGAAAPLLRERLDAELAVQARRVDLAICNTEGLGRFAADLGIRNSKVIPLGTVPEMFGRHVPPTPRLPRTPGCLNVVWSGNPEAPWHDWEIIRAAAWKLRGEHDIRFYILGDVPREVSFPDNVACLGPIPYEKTPPYYRAMDVGLALYRDAWWSRYGVFSSPLKLFDYFAAELAVIASPIEQVTRCVRDGENGFIVPFGDTEALVARLRFLATHRERAEAVGTRARELATSYYNWRRVAAETAASMHELFDVPRGADRA